jgi:erythromycin esterase-like protein
VGAFLLNRTLEKIREHVAQTAVRFAEPFDGGAADIEYLSCLDDAVANADIVVLGELNHFVHEKTDFRLYFCRYLLSRGFASLAEELGWSDGVRVDRYLNGGGDEELRRLPSFGYDGHKRDDRNDRPTGILKRAFDSYPTALFVAEQSRFYCGLRRTASTNGLPYFGFDIDGSPGGAYEDVDGILAQFADGPPNQAFRKALARVAGESVDEEVRRLRRAIEPMPGSLPADAQRRVRASLAALIDSLDYVARTYGAKTYDQLRPGMAFREDAMKRRLAAIEQLCGANKKLVVMGHALHLVKDDTQLAADTAGVGPGGGHTFSLGHHLTREKGRRVCAIWFLYGGGEDSQPFPELPRRAAFPRDTINTVLSEFGMPLFFRTGAQAFREPVRIGHMYNAVVAAPLGMQADAVFFLPFVTPLRAAEPPSP